MATFIQLKDKILIHQIKSSSPTKLFFNKENSTLKFSLFDYGKSPDSNFVIKYREKIENFNFKEITKKS